MKIHRENSEAKFSQQFNYIDATNGTENIVLSDDELFGDENDNDKSLNCSQSEGGRLSKKY